jgi:hypothetical protein
MRSRIQKQSISPDKYTINNNLVVQLADPIRKPMPDGRAKMYQTQYKTGATKATFFPSTATATTNGSSGAGDNGSSDPRRTTNGSSRGGI